MDTFYDPITIFLISSPCVNIVIFLNTRAPLKSFFLAFVPKLVSKISWFIWYLYE